MKTVQFVVVKQAEVQVETEKEAEVQMKAEEEAEVQIDIIGVILFFIYASFGTD